VNVLGEHRKKHIVFTCFVHYVECIAVVHNGEALIISTIWE
jgi:hypothetical protein